MALQTDYNETQPAAVAGAQATMVPATIISRNVEDDDGIGFGKAVFQGEADKGVTASGGDFVGITLLDRSAHGADQFPEGTSARVMTKGDIWAEAAAAVAAGDAVHALADGVLSNTGGAAIAGARWDTSAEAGQLAVIRLG